MSVTATVASATSDDRRVDPWPAWVALVALGAAAAASLVGVLATSLGAAVVLMVGVSGMVVGWSDATLRRVPNVVVTVMSGWALAVGAAVADDAGLVFVLIGAATAAMPFLVLHLVNPEWVGFGDVKLLAALGALLGLLSVSGGLAALWLAGLLAMVSRPFVPTSWKRNVPFGFWLSVSSTPVAIVLWVAQ